MLDRRRAVFGGAVVGTERHDRRARASGKDRATLLRDLLRAAPDRDKEDEVVAAYRSGHLSLSQAAALVDTDVWSLFDTLAQRGRQ